MKKTIITSIVAAAGLAVSGLASAAAAPMMGTANHWYIGIGMNYNAIQKDKHKFYFDCVEPTLDLDDHDIGVNIFVGDRLTNHFANELGVDLIGDTRWKGSAESITTGYLVFKVHDIYHVYYDGYFFMPLMHPSFEVFAKGGVSYLEAKNNLKVHCDTSSDPLYNSTIRTFALNYGGGLQFNAEQFALRGVYTRIVPNHDSDDFHVLTDTINLDFIWFLS